MTAIQYITTVMCHSQSGSIVIRLYTQGFASLKALLLKLAQLSNFLLKICMHFHRAQHREHVLTPLQATDSEGTITMVTASGRSFTRQIKTEDTAVQETNPATPGELVVGTLTISVKTLAHTYYCWYLLCVHVHIICRRFAITCTMATVYCTGLN